MSEFKKPNNVPRESFNLNRVKQPAQRAVHSHMQRNPRATIPYSPPAMDAGHCSLFDVGGKHVGHSRSRRSLRYVTAAKQPANTYLTTIQVPKSGYQRCWSSLIPADAKLMFLPRVSTKWARLQDWPRVVITREHKDICKRGKRKFMFRSLIVWTFEYFFVHPTKR